MADESADEFSYVSMSSHDRQPFHAFWYSWLRTCPRCLYSALTSEFEKLSPEERARIRDLLADPVRAVSAEDLARIRRAPDFLQGVLFRSRIARACSAPRGADPVREFWLALYDYYMARSARDGELLSAYRREWIDAARRAVDRKAFRGIDLAAYTYLLGEMLRLEKEDAEAIERFAQAKALAMEVGSGPSHRRRGEDRFLIARWSDEQAERTRLSCMPVDGLMDLLVKDYDPNAVENLSPREEVALALLAERDGDEAWSALVRLARHSPWNVAHILDPRNDCVDRDAIETNGPRLRALAMLWEGVQEPPQTARESELGSRVFDSIAAMPGRIRSASAQALDQCVRAEIAKLRAPAVPSCCRIDEFFEHLPDLLREGDGAACDYVGDLLEHAASIHRDEEDPLLPMAVTEYRIPWLLAAIVGTPAIQGRFLERAREAAAHQPVIQPGLLCLLYATGDDRARDILIGEMCGKSRWDLGDARVVGLFAMRRDPGLRAEAYIRLYDRGSSIPEALAHYLLALGQDPEALFETAARLGSDEEDESRLWRQRGMDEILLYDKLRRLLTASSRR